MKPYLSLIDTNTTGNRNDVTPLFADRDAFSSLIADLAQPFVTAGLDAVLAIDALGFILGTAVAERLGVGLIPVRKGGKLPIEAERLDFVDYTGRTKALELRPDAIQEGMRLLVVDEWVETGAQVTAAIALAERQGGSIAGIATICMDENEKTSPLREAYRVHSIWKDETLPGSD